MKLPTSFEIHVEKDEESGELYTIGTSIEDLALSVSGRDMRELMDNIADALALFVEDPHRDLPVLR